MLKTIKNKLILSVLVLIFLLQTSSSVVQISQVQGKLIDSLESNALNITTVFLLKIETKMKQLINLKTEETPLDKLMFPQNNNTYQNPQNHENFNDLLETYALVYGARDFPSLLQAQKTLKQIQFVSQSGVVYYHPQRENINKKVEKKLLSGIRQQKVTSLEYDNHIHVFIPFFFDDLYAGSIVLSYSTEQLQEEKSQVIISALWLMGIYLLIGGVGAWGISRTITQPIEKMSQDFKIIASGKFDQQVDTNREDELGTLAKSFSYLQNSIKEKVLFIENYNRTLEEKVLERTEDILNQKDFELQTMFRNIKQGIFTITQEKTIEEQFSVHLQMLLETNAIAGTHIMETLFGRSNLDQNTLNFIEIGLDSILGKEMQSYGSNRHLLVNEIELNQSDGSILILEIDWHPILDNHRMVEKMMITLRDVTDIRQLQEEVKAHKIESQHIRDSLESTKGKFESYSPRDPLYSPDMLTITMLITRIVYISSWDRGRASEIYLEDAEEPIKSLIPLQKIEDALFGKLIRPHFSYLVNPAKAWQIQRRSSSDYELVFQEYHVPISRINYLKIKKTFKKS